MEQLLKRIQKLEVEAFESNLNGLSCLFETGQTQNLEIKDFGYHCKTSVNEINISSNATKMVNTRQVPISFSHMKDRAEHERLAFAVDKLIEGHYKQNGIGKFFKIFKNKSTGTLRIPSPRVKSICAKTQDCPRTMTQLIQGKKFVI